MELTKNKTVIVVVFGAFLGGVLGTFGITIEKPLFWVIDIPVIFAFSLWIEFFKDER